MQFLLSRDRVKPAGQEQEKRPGALWQVWEQGLGPSKHSSLSGEGCDLEVPASRPPPARGAVHPPQSCGAPLCLAKGAAHPCRMLPRGPGQILLGSQRHPPLQGEDGDPKRLWVPSPCLPWLDLAQPSPGPSSFLLAGGAAPCPEPGHARRGSKLGPCPGLSEARAVSRDWLGLSGRARKRQADR